jgi:predicted nucleic acid-binding protein
MSGVVVDASSALSWLFEDERDASSVAALRHVQAEGALAPRLWWWEVANAIILAERRRRIPATEADRMFEEAESLPIRSESDESGFGAELALARRFRLSIYDAVYLELALRTHRQLVTRDAALSAAARELGLLWSA